jgi:putative OPT family oligopeptide transporter
VREDDEKSEQSGHGTSASKILSVAEGPPSVPREIPPTSGEPAATLSTRSEDLVPYVPASRDVPEFTVRAMVLGTIIGIVFGAANSFLGLKTGLTVTASIPAAVMSMAILRGVFKTGTILENNIVQTLGSTGESLAAGVIFTVPALVFLGMELSKFDIFLMAVMGSMLGILLMIPLRQYLMVREHKTLPFPEGTACANVLIVGEEGGVKARHVFYGIAVGGLYRFAMVGLRLWRDIPAWSFARLHKAAISFELSPILLGVGYLIGPRIAATMLSGGLLGWFVLIPLFDLIGGRSSSILYPGTMAIGQMSSDDIWNYYIRYIGAGGVAVGGLISLAKALPTVVSSARHSISGLSETQFKARPLRTEQDMPLSIVAALSLITVALIFFLPQFGIGGIGTLIAVVMSFFFVTVSSRMVGLIGTTSQPVSGMTITALLFTSLVFAAMGRTGMSGMAAAVTVGAIVCIAICLSGDMSQDLKTGALVGATPRKQQWAEIIGMLPTAIFTGWVLALLHKAYGLGSKELSAPQARLMADLVRGVMGGQLPWGLLMTGVSIGVVVELLGVPALPFAIGLYLPISTSSPIIFGGIVALAVSRFSRGELLKQRQETGMLYSSGLIAGDALMGIVIAALTVISVTLGSGQKIPLIVRLALRRPEQGGAGEDVLSIAIFGLLCVLLSVTIFRTREKTHGSHK